MGDLTVFFFGTTTAFDGRVQEDIKRPVLLEIGMDGVGFQKIHFLTGWGKDVVFQRQMSDNDLGDVSSTTGNENLFGFCGIHPLGLFFFLFGLVLFFPKKKINIFYLPSYF